MDHRQTPREETEKTEEMDDSRGTDEDKSTSENQDTGSRSGRIQPRPKRRRHTDDPIRGTKFANGLTRRGEFADKFIKPE